MGQRSVFSNVNGRRRFTAFVVLLLTISFFFGLNWYKSGLMASHPSSAQVNFTKLVSKLLLRNPRVGVQVGHLNANNHPDELAILRNNTGGSIDGIDEVSLNLAIAEHLQRLLEAQGIVVDLLPAKIPRRYSADLVLSIHIDANVNRHRRGYKSAHFMPPRSPAEPALKKLVDRAYLLASGFPHDEDNLTSAMLEYYAFNYKRFRHSVHRTTPSLIVELGYLSNPKDLSYLEDSQAPAGALAKGVVEFLRLRGRLMPP